MFGKGKSSNRFVDTDDYKSGDYDKGIIEDYSNLVEGDGVEWVYVAPGVHLADYKIKIDQFKNKSEVTSNSMMKSLEQTLNESLSRNASKSPKGTLTADGAVYWAERSSEGKRWIPYAGGHLAQAGVGSKSSFVTARETSWPKSATPAGKVIASNPQPRKSPTTSRDTFPSTEPTED